MSELGTLRKGETHLSTVALTTLAGIKDCGAMLKKLEFDRLMILNSTEYCFKDNIELYERTVIFINELNISLEHIGETYVGFIISLRDSAESLKDKLEKEMEERFVMQRKGE